MTVNGPVPPFTLDKKLEEVPSTPYSKLSANGVAENLGKDQDAVITERLNVTHNTSSEPIDAALASAQLEAIGRGSW